MKISNSSKIEDQLIWGIDHNKNKGDRPRLKYHAAKTCVVRRDKNGNMVEVTPTPQGVIR